MLLRERDDFSFQNLTLHRVAERFFILKNDRVPRAERFFILKFSVATFPHRISF